MNRVSKERFASGLIALITTAALAPSLGGCTIELVASPADEDTPGGGGAGSEVVGGGSTTSGSEQSGGGTTTGGGGASVPGSGMPGAIDIAQTSVSGLSSGAYMAVQLHVAHASIMVGVGAFAGGPYGCARGRWSRR